MRSYIVTNKTLIIKYLIFLSYFVLLLLQRIKNSCGYFTISEIVLFFFVVLLFTVILFLIINYFFDDKFLSIILTLLLSYLFFNGHLIYLFFEQKLNSYEYFSSKIINKVSVIAINFVFLMVLIVSVYKSFTKLRRRTIQFFLLFMGLSLMVEMILVFKAQTLKVVEAPVLKLKYVNEPIYLPNIYYIIFDSYTSPESLTKYWNYSDEQFMKPKFK